MDKVIMKGTLEDEHHSTKDIQGMTYGEIGVKQGPKEKTPYLGQGSKYDM
jgi:hypothetical protein